MIWSKDEFYVSDDKNLIDVDVVHGFLSEAYWSKNISRKTVINSLNNSLNFSAFSKRQQVGFARVISDRATIAYLGDVFVLESFRGKGIGQFMMKCIKTHPDLQNLRRWILATRDAHSLYAKFGFTELKNPEIFMESSVNDIYSTL